MAVAGETVLDCPAEVGDDAVDVVAVRRVEAFLWALRRLNQQLAREAVAGQAGPGQPLQLGALLADTCSSSLRAMTLAARLRTPGQDQDGYVTHKQGSVELLEPHEEIALCSTESSSERRSIAPSALECQHLCAGRRGCWPS